MTPNFRAARETTSKYSKQLSSLADVVANLIKSAVEGDVNSLSKIEVALRNYADAIDPWARAVSIQMIAEINQRQKASWFEYAKRMSKGLQRELSRTDLGRSYRDLTTRQVDLIKSLPLEAARQVHELATKAMVEGTRPDTLAEEIAKMSGLPLSRAKLIARTETSRAASTLLQARAQAVGSDAYIWRTVQDGRVRPSHKNMEGKVVRWDSPPRLDGMVGHAGEHPNCRCTAEPILPHVKDLEL